ncbi:MAG: hypothetical protein P4K98_03620 [Bryobacteraceae bacterium]|nr:hypothetical protein [Bryobacteraceae bacterium]
MIRRHTTASPDHHQRLGAAIIEMRQDRQSDWRGIGQDCQDFNDEHGPAAARAAAPWRSAGGCHARNGEVVALLPIGDGRDAARFDASRKLVFSSNRDGSLSMIRGFGADHFIAPLLQTAPGARTMEIDPESGDVFLVTADVLSILPPSAPNKPPRYSFKPGTLKLLVYHPASMGAP